MKFFSSSALLYYLIFTLCFFMVYPYIFDVKLFLGGDNANYYILAKGLASGEGYVNYHTPSGVAANHFPPGYSFLMSVVMRFVSDTVSAMKALNGVLLLISTFIFFQIVYKLSKNKILALILALLILLNARLLEFATIMMSEMAYMTLVLLTVYFFIIYKEKNYALKSPYFYLSILSLIALIYTRAQGIGILAAVLFFLIIVKQYKAAIIAFALCFIALLPWQMRSANLGGSTYMKQVMSVDPYNHDSPKMKIGDWGERIKDNFGRYLSKEIPSAVFPYFNPSYKDPRTNEITSAPTHQWILGSVIILLTLFGVWSLKTYRWLFLPLFGAAFVIFMLWPQVWFGNRFMLPMVPLTLLFTALGIFYCIKRVKKSKEDNLTSKKIAYGFSVLLFLQITPIKNLHEKAEKDHPKNWSNFLLAGEWCKDNLPENAIIASRKPALTYAMSQKKSIGFPYTANREEFIRLFEESGATHVIVEQLGFSQTAKFLVPVVSAEKDKFYLVKNYNAKKQRNSQGQIISPRSAVWVMEFNPNLGYIGPYKNGIREGEGKYTYKNGSVMEGTWIKDTLNGEGILSAVQGRDKDGVITTKYEGTWIKGKKEGTFIVTSKGDKHETEWVNDVIQPIGYLLDENGNRVKQIPVK